MTTDQQQRFERCMYSVDLRGECDCPKCAAEGCDDCVAHRGLMIDGKWYCLRHFLNGTGNDEPRGILTDDD